MGCITQAGNLGLGLGLGVHMTACTLLSGWRMELENGTLSNDYYISNISRIKLRTSSSHCTASPQPRHRRDGSLIDKRVSRLVVSA
jgi:hypothetical protein